MVTEQEIQNNFLGKPYTFKMKGNDGKEYEFKMEQFSVDDLPDFMPLINLFLKSNGNINSEDYKSYLPWVKKVMALSYPSINKNTMDSFIVNNLTPLIVYMIETNIRTLVNPIINEKGEEGFKKFIEEKQEVLNGKCDATVSTESTNS